MKVQICVNFKFTTFLLALSEAYLEPFYLVFSSRDLLLRHMAIFSSKSTVPWN